MARVGGSRRTGPIDLIDKIIQGLIFTVGVNAAIAAATAALPFLGLPIISNIFRGIVNYVATQIYNVLEPVVIFTVIDDITNAENQAYVASIRELQLAIASGDQNAIDAATAKTRDALSKLIHFDH